MTPRVMIHMNPSQPAAHVIRLNASHIIHGSSHPMAQPLTRLLGPEVDTNRDPGPFLIAGITADSRAVAPGFLFAAMPGVKADGARFIAAAIANGAAAILAGRDGVLPDPCPVPVLRAANPRRALALIAARFYGPGPDTIVAVTGTAGKTSVAEFTRQIFAHAGHKAASLGTIGVIKPDGATYGSLTTPDPITLACTLAELRTDGITHLAMEASSHGLDQHRLDGVQLAAAAFTNLGRDHMDYHPTVEHYFNAKMRLFRELLVGWPAAAVINMDGAFSDEALAVARASKDIEELFTVGAKGETIKLLSVTRDGFRQKLEISVDIEGHAVPYVVDLPLVGAYQVENALTALGLAAATGQVGWGESLTALSHLKGVPGRLDIVGHANGGLGVVDYAHKPEALAAALDAVRPFATGKLICVFGCGGDRDRGKRPIMGAISSAKADVTIVTDDNPRSEAPRAIRAEILVGSRGAREIGDRAQAIQTAVGLMGPGDVVLVAGKGHETGQIVGDTVLPFCDHDVLAAAMAKVRQP